MATRKQRITAKKNLRKARTAGKTARGKKPVRKIRRGSKR